MAKIIGNTTATPNPRPDWNQTDSTKADYIKNKPAVLTTADSELSETSENPIQNKVVATAFGEAYQVLQNIASLIPTEDSINALIDEKLGVIENGTY